MPRIAQTTPSGNAYIDAFTTHYTWMFATNEERVLKYRLTDREEAGVNPERYKWNDAEKAAAKQVFDTISSYIDLKFVEATSGVQIRISLDDLKGAAGLANVPNRGASSLGITLDADVLNPKPGDPPNLTLMHEALHTLGLWDTKWLAWPEGGKMDFKIYSIMSYHGTFFTPTTPMAFDIAALQHMYGANMSANVGDTVYEIKDGAFRISCIWDAGGNDTIVYNGSKHTTINLNDASLIPGDADAGGAVSRSIDPTLSGAKKYSGNAYTIANGAVIENATGGSGNDTLIGNEHANVLTGNGGNDSLEGDGANDTLRGGAGDDTFHGGAGDDVIDGGVGNDVGLYSSDWTAYRISTTGGTITIQGADGRDTVRNVEQFNFANGSFTAANIVDIAPVVVTRSLTADENRVGELGDIVATDANTALGDKVVFSLKDSKSIFAINPEGKLSLKQGAALDAETQMRHNVVVVATDSKGLQTEATITINVRDVSEKAVSKLTDTDATENVLTENAATGAKAGILARATDDITDRLTYSLDDNAGGRFAINATTGEVTVANGRFLDFEAAASHDIVIRVRSSDGSYQTLKQTIRVADAAEHIKLSDAANIYKEVGATELSVDLAGGNDVYWGDHAANTVFGGNGEDYINAQGGDDVIDGGAGDDWLLGRAGNDRIAGGAGDDFIRGGEGDDTINGGDGVDIVAFSGLWSEYTVVETASGLVVTDKFSSRDGRDVVANTEKFHFTDGLYDLAEVIDTAPVILSQTFRIDENTPGFVGQVRASYVNEAVGDSLTFRLKFPETSHFTIDAEGNLSLRSGVSFDAEHRSVNWVTVLVTDSKGLTSEGLIAVNVRDLPEGGVRGLADGNEAANTVAENAAAGTKVGIVARATDDVTDKLTYSLDDSAEGRFAINATTGEVTTTGASLDYERASSHEITVRVASSDGSFQRSKSTIAVEDVAETIQLGNGVDYYRERGAAEASVHLGGGNDCYWGNVGANTVFGGSGNDYISAGNGDDIIHGDSGNDWLLGRQGNDWMSGGTGNDFLRGGEGNDTFVFMETNFGRDRIADFQVSGADQDAIQFSKAIFANWTALRASMTQVDEDVVISYGANAITLENVNINKLTVNDFLFV